jgi:hypothetical protein
VIPRDVIGRLDAVLFDEFRELLRRALEGELRVTRLGGSYGEHLAAYLEHEIGAPLNVLRCIGKGEAVLAKAVEVHGWTLYTGGPLKPAQRDLAPLR